MELQSSPVTFNSNKYTIDDIRIYPSALHKYPNSGNIGELVIRHSSTNNGKTLIMCIPIKSSSVETGPQTSLEKMIELVDTDQGTINIPNFKLNTLIPITPIVSTKGGYYAYNGPPNLDNSTCSNNKNTQYIVFDIDNKDCPKISNKTYEKLKTLVTPQSWNPKPPVDGQTVSYSKTRPSVELNSDEIYIDCQPIDSTTSKSEEILVAADTKYNLKGLKWSWNDIMNHPALLFIIGILMMALFMYICKKIIYVVTTIKGMFQSGSDGATKNQ